MIFKLEVVTVPVLRRRPRVFYVEQAGFNVEQDVHPDDAHRFVKLMPPGSRCSIALTAGYVDSEPAPLKRRPPQRRRRRRRPCLPA